MEPAVAREPTTRLVIVEDEPLFRDLLCSALERTGFDVVGAFGEPNRALAMVPELRPDVALLDIELGEGLTGVQVGIRLRRILPELGIVLLSNNSDPQILSSLPADVAGGWSYLLKRTVSDIATLSRAIIGASHGLVMVDPALTYGAAIRADTPVRRLSPRQLEIVELIANGYSNAAIAARLVLSEKSVENHLTRIYQQLGVNASDKALHQRVQIALLYLASTAGR